MGRSVTGCFRGAGVGDVMGRHVWASAVVVLGLAGRPEIGAVCGAAGKPPALAARQP
jgi:hypothetical protein